MTADEVVAAIQADMVKNGMPMALWVSALPAQRTSILNEYTLKVTNAKLKAQVQAMRAAPKPVSKAPPQNPIPTPRGGGSAPITTVTPVDEAMIAQRIEMSGGRLTREQAIENMKPREEN